MTDTHDLDPTETREWLESVEDVIDRDGTERAHFLLDQAVGAARARGANLPFGSTTGYVNTIPPDQQPAFPGDLELEWRIRTINRWNAMATVVRRNKVSSEYGGHIASFASSAVLYDIGLNHFWRTRTEKHGGDLVFFQGHAIPGIYARSFMEGRLSAETLDNFRSETGGEGLSSYPHPWLMPDYWQFPTVSMGLGPLMAIYQARFMKYMHNRGLIDMADRKVWAFLGDGEMDEPESLGAIGLAAREGLDNLIFVVNCNLQRLDGPVRGNSQDHPGARGRLPRRRLERHQADLGLGLGQAAREGRDRQAAPADGRDRRRRLPDLQVEGRRLHPRAFLRQVSRRPRSWSRT